MKTYEEIISIVCDLYEDYEIAEPGFDLKELTLKMGIGLVPYSDFDPSNRQLLLKLSEDGFESINYEKPLIFYNDTIHPSERLKFTIPHELGHLCLNHDLPNCSNLTPSEKEFEANMFANEFYCPRALIRIMDLNSAAEIAETFDITFSYAQTLISKRSRRAPDLSPNERRLISIFQRNRLKKARAAI